MHTPPELFQDWTAIIPILTLLFGGILLFAGRRMHGLVVGLAGFATAFPFGVPLAIGMAEFGEEPLHAGLIAFTCIVAGTVGLVLALTLERFLVFTVGFMTGWLIALAGFGGSLFEIAPERFVFGLIGAVALLVLFTIGRATYTAVVGAALAANGILLLVDETDGGFPEPEAFLVLSLFLFALGLSYQLIVGWKERRATRKAAKVAAATRPLAFTPTGPPRPSSTFDHIRQSAATATGSAPAMAPPAPTPPAGWAPAPPAPAYAPAPVIVNNNIHITPGPGWQMAPPTQDAEGWGLSSLRARRDTPST